MIEWVERLLWTVPGSVLALALAYRWWVRSRRGRAKCIEVHQQVIQEIRCTACKAGHENELAKQRGASWSGLAPTKIDPAKAG